MGLRPAGSTDLFTVVDPHGYVIRCTPACWRDHVLPDHDSLRDREQDVALAIKQPEYGMVYRDRQFENRRVYYKRDGGLRFYIKAVVEVDDEGRTGELITAFHTANKPEGEKLIIWRE